MSEISKQVEKPRNPLEGKLVEQATLNNSLGENPEMSELADAKKGTSEGLNQIDERVAHRGYGTGGSTLDFRDGGGKVV